MGKNVDEVIYGFLNKKFGYLPHAFKLVLNKDKRISLEKITCKECVNHKGCFMKDNCNCYDKKEYNEARKMISDSEKYIEKYCRE